MLLFIEEATREILSQGAMVIILALGMYIMFRHFKDEASDLKKIIKQKDELLKQQYDNLSKLLQSDTKTQVEMTSTLNNLIKIIESWTEKK